MRTLRKALSLLLCLAMLFSFGIFSVSADPVKNQDNVDAFKDADQVGSQYEEAIDVMIGAGIIKGMSTEELALEPQGNYTRAQAAKIISYMKIGEAAAEALPVPTSDPFDDVLASMWAAKYIAYCTAEGVLVGYGDGNFGPNDTLTGYQWATMLLRAVGYDENGEYEGSEWAINVAKDAIPLGLFAGDISGASNEPLNREQAILYAFNTFTGIALVSYSTLSGTYVHDNYNEFGNVGTAGIGSTTLTGTTLGLSVYGLRAYEGDLLYGQVVNGDKQGDYFYVHGALDVIAENETVDNAGFRGRIWAVGSSTNVKAISGYHRTDVVLARSVNGMAITALLNAADPAYIGFAPSADGFTYYVDDYAGAKTTSTLEVQEAALWAAGEAYFVKGTDGYYGTTVNGELPKGTLVLFIDAAPYDQQVDKIIVQTERSYVETDPTGRVAKEVIPGAEYETYELSAAAKLATIASRDAYNAQLKTYYEQRQEFIDLLKLHFSNVTSNGTVSITSNGSTVSISGRSLITGIPYSENIATAVPFTISDGNASGNSTIIKDNETVQENGAAKTITTSSTFDATPVPGVSTPLTIEQANRLIELAKILGYQLYAKDLYVLSGNIAIIEKPTNSTPTTYNYYNSNTYTSTTSPTTFAAARDKAVADNKNPDTSISKFETLATYLDAGYARQSNYSAINGAVQQPDVVIGDTITAGDVVNVRTRIDRRIYVDKAASAFGTLREVRRDQKLINTYNLVDTQDLFKLSAVPEWLEDGNQIKADRLGIVAPNIVITSKYIGESGTYFLGTEGYVVAYKGPEHFWDDIYFVAGVQHNRNFGDSAYSVRLINFKNEVQEVPVEFINFKQYDSTNDTTSWGGNTTRLSDLGRQVAEDWLAYIEDVNDDYNLTSYYGTAVVKYDPTLRRIKVLGYFGDDALYTKSTDNTVDTLNTIADSVIASGVWSYTKGSTTLTTSYGSRSNFDTSTNTKYNANVRTYVVDSRTILYYIDGRGRVTAYVGADIPSFNASGNQVMIVPYTTAEDDEYGDETAVRSYYGTDGKLVSARKEISAFTDPRLRDANGNSIANADMETRQLAKAIILRGSIVNPPVVVGPTAYGAISDVYRDANGITRVTVVSALDPQNPVTSIVASNTTVRFKNYDIIQFVKNADDTITITKVMGPQDFSFVENHSQTNGAANYIVRGPLTKQVYNANGARGLWVDRNSKQIYSTPINYTYNASDFNKDKGYMAIAFVVPPKTVSADIEEVYYVPARYLDPASYTSTADLAKALSQADINFYYGDWTSAYAVEIPSDSAFVIRGNYNNTIDTTADYNTLTNNAAVNGTTVRENATFSVIGNYEGTGATTVFGYLDVDGIYQPSGETVIADGATVDIDGDVASTKAMTIGATYSNNKLDTTESKSTGSNISNTQVIIDGNYKAEDVTNINGGTITVNGNYDGDVKGTSQLTMTNAKMDVKGDFDSGKLGDNIGGTLNIAGDYNEKCTSSTTATTLSATTTIGGNFNGEKKTTITGTVDVTKEFIAGEKSDIHINGSSDKPASVTAADVTANKVITLDNDKSTLVVSSANTLTLDSDDDGVKGAITGAGTLKLAGLPTTTGSSTFDALKNIVVGKLVFTEDVTFNAVVNSGDTYAINADTVVFEKNITLDAQSNVTFKAYTGMSSSTDSTTGITTYTASNSNPVKAFAKQYVTLKTDDSNNTATVTAPSSSTLYVNKAYYPTGTTLGNFTVVLLSISEFNSVYSVSGDTKVLKVTKKA